MPDRGSDFGGEPASRAHAHPPIGSAGDVTARRAHRVRVAMSRFGTIHATEESPMFWAAVITLLMSMFSALFSFGGVEAS